MTDIRYRLFDPTGNITALVETPVPEDKQPVVASIILERNPVCEQVGFISAGTEGADITLRMAGGEFCGNATMCTAAFYAACSGIDLHGQMAVTVKVLGTPGLINVSVRRDEFGFTCSVNMPPVKKISTEMFKFEGHNYSYPVVSFESISHVIVTDDMSIHMAETAISQWCQTLGSKGLGLMMLYNDNKALRPLVYIKHPETLFWESSCASGTTAVGAYFAHETGHKVLMPLKEPGGILTIEADPDGSLLLTGCVEFDGKTHIL